MHPPQEERRVVYNTWHETQIADHGDYTPELSLNQSVLIKDLATKPPQPSKEVDARAPAEEVYHNSDSDQSSSLKSHELGKLRHRQRKLVIPKVFYGDDLAPKANLNGVSKLLNSIKSFNNSGTHSRIRSGSIDNPMLLLRNSENYGNVSPLLLNVRHTSDGYYRKEYPQVPYHQTNHRIYRQPSALYELYKDAHGNIHYHVHNHQHHHNHNHLHGSKPGNVLGQSYHYNSQQIPMFHHNKYSSTGDHDDRYVGRYNSQIKNQGGPDESHGYSEGNFENYNHYANSLKGNEDNSVKYNGQHYKQSSDERLKPVPGNTESLSLSHGDVNSFDSYESPPNSHPDSSDHYKNSNDSGDYSYSDDHESSNGVYGSRNQVSNPVHHGQRKNLGYNYLQVDHNSKLTNEGNGQYVYGHKPSYGGSETPKLNNSPVQINVGLHSPNNFPSPGFAFHSSEPNKLHNTHIRGLDSGSSISNSVSTYSANQENKVNPLPNEILVFPKNARIIEHHVGLPPMLFKTFNVPILFGRHFFEKLSPNFLSPKPAFSHNINYVAPFYPSNFFYRLL